MIYIGDQVHIHVQEISFVYIQCLHYRTGYSMSYKSCKINKLYTQYLTLTNTVFP